MQLMELLKDSHLTFKKTAELSNLSTNTIINTFYNNRPNPKSYLPEVLYIDAIYLGHNASKKHVVVLLDFKTNQIVDIIYGGTKNALHSYFQKFSKEALNKTITLSCDMYEGYRFLQRS
jgi:transposase